MVTGTLARRGETICDQLHGRPAPIAENFGRWAFFVLAALGRTFALAARRRRRIPPFDGTSVPE